MLNLPTGRPYEICKYRGIPIDGSTFKKLSKMVKPDELLVAIFKYGPDKTLKGCYVVQNAEDCRELNRRKRKDLVFEGYYALKKSALREFVEGSE